MRENVQYIRTLTKIQTDTLSFPAGFIPRGYLIRRKQMRAVDLHTHSNRSDGSMSPTELIDHALEINLAAIALTDHDTTAGLDEAASYAAGKDIEFVPGIEFSTEYNKKDIHIVGLYIRYDDPGFQDYLQEFVKSRIERNIKMCKNLQDMAGIDITYEKLQSENPDSVITRAHYARYLIEHGYVKCHSEAFDRYLGDHTKYFVSREKITPEKAIDLILKAGGVPILAHPILYHMSNENLEQLVKRCAKSGLIGIEGLYSTYKPADERQIKKLADKYGLLISGGSDFHGDNKPGLELGKGYGHLFIPEDILSPIRAAAKSTSGSGAISKTSPKILFTDLDGTLLTSEKKVTEYSRSILEKFCKAGNIFVISSGRPIKSIMEVCEKENLDFPGIIISAYNGSQIYDCDNKKILMEKRLSYETVATVQKYADEHNMHVHTYTDTHLITERIDPEMTRYTKHVHMPVITVDDLRNGLDREPFKMLAIDLEDRNRLEKFGDGLVKVMNGKIQCVFSNPNYLEIIRTDAGKGNGVKIICDLLNIPLCNSYAAGDGDNDVSMIKASGCGIAMKNSSQSALACADHITESDNDHDGLAHFIESNILM